MKVKVLKNSICVIAVTIMCVSAVNWGVDTVKTQMTDMNPVLFIDPGHGGMDGGAVSSGGLPEKDINLAIALELKKLAQAEGWNVVMTRETDKWLAGSCAGSIRTRKTEDLRARRDMLLKCEPDVAVSIHLNSFREDTTVKGPQVFYPSEGEDDVILHQCRQLAETLQCEINNQADEDSQREAMTRNGVMVFSNVICPMVIVECGFLSCPEEAEMLQTVQYQRKMALGIMNGIREFTGFGVDKNTEIIDSLQKKNKS